MPRLTFIGGPADGADHDIQDKTEFVNVPLPNGGAYTYKRYSLLTIEGACFNYLASPEWDYQQVLDHMIKSWAPAALARRTATRL